MVKSTTSLLTLALCQLFHISCAAAALNGSVYLDSTRSPAERADDLLRLMTWEEKICQLGGIRRLAETVNGKVSHNATLFEEIRKTQNGQIGEQNLVALHLGVDIEHTAGFGAPQNYALDLLPIANKVRAEQINNTRLGIPYITVADSVSGLMISGGTLFPGALSMGSTWNIPLYEQAVAAIRDENVAMGTRWVLSPEVDLAKDPRNGRNGEMFGEDSYLVGEFATHYINTMQEKDENGFVKVATTIKHWVYGSGSGGVNTASIQSGLNYILNEYGAPYVKAFREANPLSLMISYASVDQIPMSMNKYLNRKVLREMLGFKGLIMSDAGSIRNMYTQSKVAKSFADAGLKALRGGLEHELSPRPPSVFPTLINYSNDTEVMDLVDISVRAILEIKFATGTFDLPLPSVENLNATLRSGEHLEINRKVSREAIVLLQNDGTLPLQRSKVSQVALLGPYADILNTGQYAANNASDLSYGDTFRRSLEREIGAENVKYVAGVDILRTNDSSDIETAVNAAKEAGLAVVVLGSGWGSFDNSYESLHRTDGEGFSHPHLGFPGLQQQLLDAVINAGVPTVLVLSGGQTFLLDESAKRAKAIIHTWLAGEFTADALVEILFGSVNPSGKLTITFPEADGAFPVAYDYFPSDDQGGFGTATQYDWHLPELTRYAPLRFGFGLSYTTFNISSISLQCHSVVNNGTVSECDKNSQVTVSATVTNTGPRDGQEVVQLYYRPEYSQIEFPVMKLIRFEKIVVAAGSSRKVSLNVPYAELGYFIDGEWQVETGLYNFWIGSSSRTQDLQGVNATLV
ncbi:periplasmic beta-glucosidase [Colletotrichum scovillei]|uniref:beta-glucosidase n=1 Tax=Colletotrichum scovillei TaxID=1209932 RepID=A0A9P7R5H3_9PEZI|nr:periplasmic beta-glucosidase [Colletotrichum scovillei]KAG7065245.1 periplasmic beta-glucosidase [Colletotrichum scovillei]KAG7067847.1 periplasmic beta-glucosidase [Colletotrichum scovillei]